MHSGFMVQNCFHEQHTFGEQFDWFNYCLCDFSCSSDFNCDPICKNSTQIAYFAFQEILILNIQGAVTA